MLDAQPGISRLNQRMVAEDFEKIRIRILPNSTTRE